jgi:titin
MSDSSLETGLNYRFYVVSENYVGLSGQASDISEYRLCQLPTGIEPPSVVSTTSTSIDLSWSRPSDDGGCSVTGYGILVADEASGSTSSLTYQEVHSSVLNSDSSITSYTITELPVSALPGTTLRFKLKVYNQGGFSAESIQATRVVLASVPS